MKIASLAVLLALQAGGLTVARAQSTPKKIEIRTLSTRADRVSGGDVLIEIVASGTGTAKAAPHVPAPNGAAPGTGTAKAVPYVPAPNGPEPSPTRPDVTLNGRDVSAAFHPSSRSGSLIGLVTNLAIGRNTLKVAGNAWGARDESLDLTNYPITGPIISGPHIQPFVCQTNTFKLQDGSTLGAPTDANCSAPRTVQYVYMPKGAKELAPLASTSTSALPA